MSTSRQISDTLSATGVHYTAPAAYANNQLQELLNTRVDPLAAAFNAAQGASATQQKLVVPINALSESGTTVTVTLGSPHNLTGTGQSIIVAGAPNGYNGTFSVTGNPGPYQLQYTASGSGLAAFPSQTCQGTVQVPNGGNVGFMPAVLGATIAGSTVSTMEVWDDGVIWDTANNRVINSQLLPQLSTVVY